jgi:hypothetical protein
MSTDMDRQLQECLAGLDAGLTPEECLSAWPESRNELEPMLRQAMLLRVAFTGAPAPEFKTRAREKLMFMAGREATQAMDAKPSEAFVYRTRQKLMRAAGASAQESLRSVPPPRLAFWMNARRRLLETATSRHLTPAPRSGILAYRSALSAAVVVLVFVVAGFAYFTVQAPKQTVGAELASIDQQLREVEQQNSAGNRASPDVLADLSTKTVAAVGKIHPEAAQAPLADKAQDLIDRQKVLVQQAVDSGPAPLALQTAQQQLGQAEAKAQEVRISAAKAPDSNTPVPQAAATLAPVNTAAPAVATAAPATPAPSASSTVAGLPLGPNDIRLRVVPGDTAFGLTWAEVETEHFRILIPASWQLIGPSFDANGLGHVEVLRLTFDAPDGAIIQANASTGEIQAIINGNSLVLRNKTALGGARLTVSDLVAETGAYAGQLDHMLGSVVHVVPTPTPTATSTATPLAPSATPPAKVTPTP